MGKTKTVIVIEPIQLTQFFMPKIGVEKVVDPGETYMEVFIEARKEIETMARQAYPDHFKQEKSFVSALAASLKNAGNPYQPVEAPVLLDAKHTIKPKPYEPVTEEVLRECKTIADLEWWFDAIDAKNGEERTALWNVYDEMFEKISQNQPA